MVQVNDFFQYMKSGMHGHLVGIGGVSMSPLVRVFSDMGIKVSGSDISDGEAVQALRADGIQVFTGHREENVEGADFVVRTAAARDDNPEIQRAHQLNIPVFERTQAWGAIMRGYKNALCIAGTHGKTTTTSMLTHIFMTAEKDPTVMIGGTLPLIGSGYRVGGGDVIILESCEYYNSYHNFSPTTAIILNVDADHLDFFGNLENIKASFRTFAELVPQDGWVVINADDENTVSAMQGIDRQVVTFGLSGGADMCAVDISYGKTTSFTAVFRGSEYARITLRVGGRHNVYNALAACAAACVNNISGSAARDGLVTFEGAGRRAERKGSFGGVDVYDDYAHHPSELHALLDMAKGMGYERILCVFQPHTFSRTKALFDDFLRELSIPDKVFLAEIYAAREKNTIGISSKDLADRLPQAVFAADFDRLADMVRAEARPGDVVITVGAGDIYKVGEKLVEK